MSDQEKIYGILLEIQRAIGKLEASTNDGRRYTQAVSAKLDTLASDTNRRISEVATNLENHEKSDSAHGIGTREKSYGDLVAWLSLASTGFLAFIEMFRGRHQ